MRSFEFRLDFFFRVGMDLIYYAINLAFYKVLFLNTPVLAGWTEPQVMVFVAGFCVVDGLQMTLFANNLWWLPTYVNRGDLDYYLVRPVSSLFFLSLRDFAVNSFINLLCALGILFWALNRYPDSLKLSKLVLYLLLIINGTLIHYLFRLLLVLPVFWIQGGRGFEQLFWGLTRSMERPDRIFRGWVWKLFTIFLPFGLMASVPTRFLFEAFDVKLFVQLVSVTIVLWVLVLALWQKALRSYASASS